MRPASDPDTQSIVELGAAEPAPVAEAVRREGREVPEAKGNGELGGKLAGLSLPAQVFALAVWPLLENLMSVMVGMVDLALAGRLEPDDVAVAATDALGGAGYFHWFMGLIMSSIGVGATAIIARAIGARHRREAHAALGQAILLSLAMGFVVLAMFWLLAPAVARLINVTEAAQPHFIDYLRIVGLGSPFMGLLFVGNACLRGAGDTRTPFLVMVIVNIVNAVLSALFVFGPAPIGGHGVAGIAWGTTIAWGVGGAVVMVVLAMGWGGIRLRLVRLRPARAMMGRLVRVGMPNLLESSGQWFGNLAVLGFVGMLAFDGAMGSHMIAIRIESISFLPGLALGTAAATLAGQYLGAGNPRQARRAIALCWAVGAGLMTLVGLLFIAVPEAFVRLISDAAQHQETVPPLLRICGPVQVFFATYLVLSQALRGAGDTRWAMRLTYSSTFLVRLPLAYLIGLHLGGGLSGLWIGLCGELIIRGCLFAARFIHGGWATVRV